ncbi:hypothetical protein CURTO8I2_130078 [Curtobacterium sp. 8I-2]|nr:hypothetical protein CURTO8I2_130078 [Curtobacterium sp. 8I-2]
MVRLPEIRARECPLNLGKRVLIGETEYFNQSFSFARTPPKLI